MKITGEDIQKVLRCERPVGTTEEELSLAYMKHGEVLARILGRELRKHEPIVAGCTLVWLTLDWLHRTDPRLRKISFEGWLHVVRTSWKKNEARERKKQRKAKP